jgi:hypothetical protein
LLAFIVVDSARVGKKQHLRLAVDVWRDVDERAVFLPDRMMLRLDEDARPFPNQPAIDDRARSLPRHCQSIR